MSDNSAVKFAPSGELLVDGSFEKANVGNDTWSHQATVGGWQSDSNIETWGQGFYGIKAADGNKWVELDYDSGKTLSNIYQNVKTEAGAEYTFTFDYMKRPDSPKNSDTINVFWNGKLVGSIDPTQSQWQVATFKVTGTGASDRIEFRESANQNDSYGGLIDNASLVKSGASTAEQAAAEKAAEEAQKAAEAAKEAAEKAAKDAAAKAAADAAAKAAADKAAAEAAAKAAADKAAADAAAKAAADKAAKDKADKDAADAKAKADQDAKDAADKAAKDKADKDAADAKAKADQDAKDAADKAAKDKADKDAADAKDKADKEAKDHADNDKSNDDGDKKDGRGHGDGDHKDDGHADNGKGSGAHDGKGDGDKDDDNEHHAGDGGNGGGVVDPPPPPPPVEAVVLNAGDATETVLTSSQTGTGKADGLSGETGSDALYGKGGDDQLTASNGRMSSLKLPIDASLVNAADASAFKVTVSGMPKGATLSAGQDNGDGSWTLGADQLKGLVISTDAASDFALKVSVSATDGSGLSQSSEVNVHVPEAASNLLVGGGGSDVIIGSENGNDTIYGGAIPTGAASDPNHVVSAADNDVIVAGNGNNHIWGNSGDDHITAGNGDNWISGGKGDDVITVGSGNNEIFGNTGDDRIFAGSGQNVVHGGAGFDTLDFSNVGSVTVDVKAKTASVAGGGVTTFDGVEAFTGSHGNDTFLAGKKGEMFTGNGGDDTFVFSRGDVVSKSVALAAHEITDFNAGDTLDLRGVFAGHNWQGLDKMVQLVEDDKGTHVYAKISQAMVEVVVLDNVHGHSVAEMVKDGSLLV